MSKQPVERPALTACPYCGELPHEKGLCPRITAIEYHGDGETVRRVEFVAPVSKSNEVFVKARGRLLEPEHPMRVKAADIVRAARRRL